MSCLFVAREETGQSTGKLLIGAFAGVKGNQAIAAAVAKYVVGFSLFVIVSVAAAGGMSAVAAGWCTFGLAATMIVLEVAKGGKENRKWKPSNIVTLVTGGLFCVTLLGIGLSGGLGALTAKQLTWGYWGSVITILSLRACGGSSIHLVNLVNNH
ncbi:MAG: hypothetical protein K940chlam9_00054 [Chlamydiae bacterium]|nr:hypothetical protein [Chlamydiota bacterium]